MDFLSIIALEVRTALRNTIFNFLKLIMMASELFLAAGSQRIPNKVKFGGSLKGSELNIIATEKLLKFWRRDQLQEPQAIKFVFD